MEDDIDFDVMLRLENNEAPGQINTRIKKYRDMGFRSPVRKVVGEFSGCVDMVRGGHYSRRVNIPGLYPLADHDFIYLGSDVVAEVGGDTGNFIDRNRLNDENAIEFNYSGLRERNGRDFGHSEYTKEEVASRAMSYSNHEGWNYDKIRNNCQHFAYWCQTGYFKSRVVNANVDDDTSCTLNRYRGWWDGLERQENKWKPRFSRRPMTNL